ncbi:hypothetical protein ACE6H2_009381 [Prunus campanulata]
MAWLVGLLRPGGVGDYSEMDLLPAVVVVRLLFRDPSLIFMGLAIRQGLCNSFRAHGLRHGSLLAGLLSKDASASSSWQHSPCRTAGWLESVLEAFFWGEGGFLFAQ